MLNRLLRRQRPTAGPTPAAEPAKVQDTAYADRVEAEKSIYADQEVVHDLPPIFYYWFHNHLRPIFEATGIASIEEAFVGALAAGHAERTHGGPSRFISIGAGNCDAEVAMAVGLRSRGIEDFVIECLELNPVMLERGAAAARDRGVGENVVAVEADFNAWRPEPGIYDGAVANQALHHVLNLEGLYDGLREGLRPEGRFVLSDMIGRNGHQRWPEALAVLTGFWAELPPNYRFHRQLQRQEDEFLDWDCSREGFEGVRAQDVLPLMVERFAFERFVGFANVITPFVDRGFGPNFDADADWDRNFIDRVHARDADGLQSGELKPTQLVATARLAPRPCGPAVWGRLTPEFAVRPTNAY